LFSEKRGLYQVQYRKQTHLFKLGDAVTGAMIAGLVDQATSQAMKRDLGAGKQTGVGHKDFQEAVNTVYRQHADLNPTFDLEDFCDDHEINRQEATFAKMAKV
jgi:SpoVK/Ycf46/Vps4 family AAA+-type ATPase